MPFYFYTVILGMVVGAVLTWFLVADHPFEAREAPGGPVDALEAGLIASQMKAAGIDIDEPAITKVLQMHGAYVVGDNLDESGNREEADAAAGDEEATQPTA